MIECALPYLLGLVESSFLKNSNTAQDFGQGLPRPEASFTSSFEWGFHLSFR